MPSSKKRITSPAINKKATKSTKSTNPTKSTNNKQEKVVIKRNLKKFQQETVLKFLEMLNVVKLYHWKTHSFATHRATDELYQKLNEHIDTFIEVLLGKDEGRIDLTKVKSIEIEDFTNVEPFKKRINSYKSYLIKLNKNTVLDKELDSDLFNIRDEILADLNQFTYLLTFV